MLRLIATLLICTLLGMGNAFAQPLSVNFSADTVHACLGEPFEVNPMVSGGTMPYIYSWKNGTSDSTLTIIPLQDFTDIKVVVTDGFGATDSAKLVVHSLTECVYPGDANGDGAANNLDLLSLGLAYGHSGFQRPNAHLNWIGQPSFSWQQSFSNGINFAHVDGDGNGVLDADDIEAITHNYITPSFVSNTNSSSGVPLSVEIDALNVLPGDTVVARVMLGSPLQPADSIYGIAFSLELEGYEIDSGSFQISYNGSALGGSGQILTVEKAFYDRTRIEIGITRFDGSDTTTFGQLVEIIVVIDEIIGKRKGIAILDFNLEDVSMNNGTGENISVNPGNSAVNIVTSNTKLEPELDIKVSDLQGKGWMLDLGNNSQNISSIKLFSLNGNLVQQKTFGSNEIFIPGNGLAKGVYLMRLESDKKIFSRKILKK
ncbi:MAG: T9SS type A sorting domain-containing protein [Bacteroidia bacterium]|nr:T9SS type A sorting domain-containing protein [Bacteroidia bacterium]